MSSLTRVSPPSISVPANSKISVPVLSSVFAPVLILLTYRFTRVSFPVSGCDSVSVATVVPQRVSALLWIVSISLALVALVVVVVSPCRYGGWQGRDFPRVRESPQPTINKPCALTIQTAVERVCRGGTGSLACRWVALPGTRRRWPTLLRPAVVGIWLETAAPPRFCLAAAHALQASTSPVMPSRAQSTQPPG